MTYISKCTGCGRCLGACPAKAISIGEKSGKMAALTDRGLCTECGACVSVCPQEARELAGKEMTVREVLEKVERDRLFIETSGGGMTLSGGECLMHPDFSEAMLYAAHEAGFHTAVESCSFAPNEVVTRVFSGADLCLLDIKHMDSITHRRLTGVPNELILGNIRYTYHILKKQVTVRVPTIPGYNDSKANITATARFVADKLGGDVPIHLLPYHRLGESKNESLGKDMDMTIDVPSDEHMQELLDIVKSFGLSGQVGG